MKKVGLVSVRNYNYGSILQAYVVIVPKTEILFQNIYLLISVNIII